MYSAEDREGLARLITSETSDRTVWPYILSTAILTARRRNVSITELLRTRRQQRTRDHVYIGHSEYSNVWGPLIETIDDTKRWVRWASTRQPGSIAAEQAVALWIDAGSPLPEPGFVANSFHEADTVDEAQVHAAALRRQGKPAWTQNRWVFRSA